MRIGISGSTIRSHPNRLDELFWDGTEHIEIGSLPNRSTFEKLLHRAADLGRSVGIHSPLLIGGSRRDLIESVDYPSERGWDQIEDEARYAARLNVDYLLVHFPYFETDLGTNAESLVDGALQRLGSLQQATGCNVVCEPKLGADRHTGCIDLLRAYPVERWADAGIRLCWDVGDYLIGTRDEQDYLEQLDRWIDHIAVVHLHNARRGTGRYTWTPAHESFESDPEYYPLASSLRRLSEREITIVLEHTPSEDFDTNFAASGLNWVKQTLEEGGKG